IKSTQTSVNIFNTNVDNITLGGKPNGVLNLGSSTTTLNVPGYIKRTWKTVTTTRNAISGDFLLIDNSVTNVQVTLPDTPDVGDVIWFADKSGLSQTRKLFIYRNGNKINGLESDLEISTPNRVFSLTYTGVVRGWCWDKDSWKTIVTNYTAIDGDKLLIDNSSSSISTIIVTLPASPQTGDTIKFIDQKGLTAIKPLVVQRNGSLINGVASDLTVTTAGKAFTLVYTGITRGWCYDNT
ncbi:hypothetical protein EBU71_14530, partial [bacterium]|nr:hypothetical protein [Candidatus Elulimicrobium humile]